MTWLELFKYIKNKLGEIESDEVKIVDPKGGPIHGCDIAETGNGPDIGKPVIMIERPKNIINP